jgi:hypothetical protein
LKECKSGYNADIYTPMFVAALFTKGNLLKQTRCPTTDEWIKKMCIIHPQRGMKLYYLQVNGWEWRSPCLSKVSSERQRLHVFSQMWKIDPEDKCTQTNFNIDEKRMVEINIKIHFTCIKWG